MIITNGREKQINIGSQNLTNKFQYKANARYIYIYIYETGNTVRILIGLVQLLEFKYRRCYNHLE